MLAPPLLFSDSQLRTSPLFLRRLRSHVPKISRIKFSDLSSSVFPCYIPCFQPRLFVSSDQPMSYSLFCSLPRPVFSSYSRGRERKRRRREKCACLSKIRCYFFATELGLAVHLTWSEASFHVLRADHSHVHRHLFLKQQGMPLRPLDAKNANVPHDRSLLFPSLYLKNLLPPRLLLFASPSVHPHAFRPEKRSHGGQLLDLHVIHLQNKTTVRPTLSCLLLPPSVALNVNQSVSEMT